MGFMQYGAAYGAPDRRPPIDFEGIRQGNPIGQSLPITEGARKEPVPHARRTRRRAEGK